MCINLVLLTILFVRKIYSRNQNDLLASLLNGRCLEVTFACLVG